MVLEKNAEYQGVSKKKIKATYSLVLVTEQMNVTVTSLLHILSQ